MKRQTFIITRFSYRGREALASVGGPSWYRGVDPLDPDRLQQRFMLFRMSCLPSLSAQSDTDFTWVIIIDRALPQRFADELIDLTAGLSRVVLHVFDPETDLAAVAWLAPYTESHVTHVVTMNMDDDDVLPTNYVEWVHADIDSAHARDELPPARLIASTRINQWDLLPSPIAPLGWRADWHREQIIAASGMTICCDRAANADINVMGIRHTTARPIFDCTQNSDDPNVVFWRSNSAIRQLAEWPVDQCIAEVGAEIDPVLMLNHSSNDQAGRLWVDKRGKNRARVTRHSFDGYPLDWQAVYKYKKHFSILRTGYLWQKVSAKLPSSVLWRLRRIQQLLRPGGRSSSSKSG